MYKAKCYVRCKGKTYEPGECIPDGLTSEAIEWLSNAGAIEEVAPAAPASDPEPVYAMAIQVPEDFPEVDDTETVEEAAPEINVMDGVVQDKPKKTTRKTSGRRKSK